MVCKRLLVEITIVDIKIVLQTVIHPWPLEISEFFSMKDTNTNTEFLSMHMLILNHFFLPLIGFQCRGSGKSNTFF